MAITYDETVATDRAIIRLALTETNEQTCRFTDAEIDSFRSRGGSIDAAIGMGLKVLMAHAALRGQPERVHAIRDTLRTYGQEMPAATVIFPASLPMDAGYDETDP